MDLKGRGDYDCQVADFAVNCKQTRLTEKEIAQILRVLENRLKPLNSNRGDNRVCTEWILTISPDNNISLIDANASYERSRQVTDFMEKGSAIHTSNENYKEKVDVNTRNLNVVKPLQNPEMDMKKHFLTVDQKLRRSMQQKKSKSFWSKTSDAFCRVFKK